MKIFLNVVLGVVLLMLIGCTPAFEELPNGKFRWRGYNGCIEAVRRGYNPQYSGKTGVAACEQERDELFESRQAPQGFR